MKLRSNPKFSDVTLKINGKIVPAHKCLLAARSGKFKMMFEAQMCEQGEHTIVIDTQKPQLFMSLIDWIYSSELDFPDSTADIFELILLADEYLLEDLRRKCEDGLIYRLDQDNALEILVVACKYPTIASDNLIEYAINTLIEDFDVILRKHPKLEDELKSKFDSHRRCARARHEDPDVHPPAKDKVEESCFPVERLLTRIPTRRTQRKFPVWKLTLLPDLLTLNSY